MSFCGARGHREGREGMTPQRSTAAVNEGPDTNCERYSTPVPVPTPHLEAAAAEAHGRLQELRADARVRADGLRDLVDVRARRFAQRRHRVDAGDALREDRVGDELGQLRRPQVRRDDLRGVRVA